MQSWRLFGEKNNLTLSSTKSPPLIIQTAANKTCSQAFQVASLQYHIAEDPKVPYIETTDVPNLEEHVKQTERSNTVQNSFDIIHGHTSPECSNAVVVQNDLHDVVEPTPFNV